MTAGRDVEVLPARSSGVPTTRSAARPQVTNINRIVVGFPFSTIRIDDSSAVAAVAVLLARLCAALAESPAGNKVGELEEIAAEAEKLAQRLQR